MVRFEWKYPDKEQFPPEPKYTKDYWKQEHPDWDKWAVLDWYAEHFEMYACRLKGEDDPVPTQLYYLGDREWMSDSGYILSDGHVEAWDSYGPEETPIKTWHMYPDETPPYTGHYLVLVRSGQIKVETDWWSRQQKNFRWFGDRILRWAYIPDYEEELDDSK